MEQGLVDQSIDFHGPVLIDQLANEEVNVKLPSFLSLSGQQSKCSDRPR